MGTRRSKTPSIRPSKKGPQPTLPRSPSQAHDPSLSPAARPPAPRSTPRRRAAVTSSLHPFSSAESLKSHTLDDAVLPEFSEPTDRFVIEARVGGGGMGD